jgi:hypothetical protein
MRILNSIVLMAEGDDSIGDCHLMPKLTFLAFNSTTVILHLTDIKLSLLAEAEESASMTNTTGNIPDLTLLPSETKKVRESRICP